MSTFRQHPLSFVSLAVRRVWKQRNIGVAVFVAGLALAPLGVLIAVVAVAAVAFMAVLIAGWWNSHARIDAGHLIVSAGVLHKSVTRVPLSSVSAIAFSLPTAVHQSTNTGSIFVESPRSGTILQWEFASPATFEAFQRAVIDAGGTNVSVAGLASQISSTDDGQIVVTYDSRRIWQMALAYATETRVSRSLPLPYMFVVVNRFVNDFDSDDPGYIERLLFWMPTWGLVIVGFLIPVGVLLESFAVTYMHYANGAVTVSDKNELTWFGGFPKPAGAVGALADLRKFSVTQTGRERRFQLATLRVETRNGHYITKGLKPDEVNEIRFAATQYVQCPVDLTERISPYNYFSAIGGHAAAAVAVGFAVIISAAPLLSVTISATWGYAAASGVLTFTVMTALTFRHVRDFRWGCTAGTLAYRKRVGVSGAEHTQLFPARTHTTEVRSSRRARKRGLAELRVRGKQTIRYIPTTDASALHLLLTQAGHIRHEHALRGQGLTPKRLDAKAVQGQ